MKRRLFPRGMLVLLACIMQLRCSTPQYFWPQKDAQISELNPPSLEKKILVASRSSAFEDAVVGRTKEAFKDESVSMRFTGIDQLKKENSAGYSAVVVINTCMGWNMDRHVKGFLKRQRDQSNMIILTTSGDGNWKPKMKKYNFDAISSASEMHKVDEVADEIIARTRALLQKG